MHTSSDHLDADALFDALVDGLLCVVAGRVEQGQQADHVPRVSGLRCPLTQIKAMTGIYAYTFYGFSETMHRERYSCDLRRHSCIVDALTVSSHLAMPRDRKPRLAKSTIFSLTAFSSLALLAAILSTTCSTHTFDLKVFREGAIRACKQVHGYKTSCSPRGGQYF